MDRRKLTDVEIASRLANFPLWTVSDGKLTRTFQFKSYASGVLFASAVGHEADRLDHHPDLTIGYQRVTIAVNTHDADGITDWDFELARRADYLVS